MVAVRKGGTPVNMGVINFGVEKLVGFKWTGFDMKSMGIMSQMTGKITHIKSNSVADQPFHRHFTDIKDFLLLSKDICGRIKTCHIMILKTSPCF